MMRRSHRSSEPRTRSRMRRRVASEFGSCSRVSRPPPKSGRMSCSPGRVERMTRMVWRTLSARSGYPSRPCSSGTDSSGQPMGGRNAASISASPTVVSAAELRERNADLDEQQPAEDQVEQLQKDVENDEGADRDDRDAEGADPLQVRIARWRFAASTGEILRIAVAQKIVERGRDHEGDVRLQALEQTAVGHVGQWNLDRRLGAGAVVPRRDDEGLTVVAPIGAYRTAALGFDAHERADPIERVELVETP